MRVDLLALLKGTELPVTYRKWAPKRAPAPPYIVYLAADSDNFGADNVVYHSATNYLIELYTEVKTTDLEARLEAALTAAGVFYEKLEGEVESEGFYQVTYQVLI